MIRAIYRDGVIQSLDALPSEWREGQELYVDAFGGDDRDESFEEWVAEINSAAAEISDEDHQRMEAALAEIEAQSKELGRRESEKCAHLFDDDANDLDAEAGGRSSRQAG